MAKAKHCEECKFISRLMGSTYCANPSSNKYLALIIRTESCKYFECGEDGTD